MMQQCVTYTPNMSEGGVDMPGQFVPKRGSSSVIWNCFGFDSLQYYWNFNDAF